MIILKCVFIINQYSFINNSDNSLRISSTSRELLFTLMVAICSRLHVNTMKVLSLFSFFDVSHIILCKQQQTKTIFAYLFMFPY